MKKVAPLALSVLLTIAVAVGASAQTPAVREVLTNESVINLTKAKFKESTIIALIRTSPAQFNISTNKLVELKKRGVSEKVITVMIERQGLGANPGLASLGDDEFFRQGDAEFFKNSPVFKELPSEKEARQRESEAQIFGSRSGSKNAVRSKGYGAPNGESSNEGETLGSATVKIIRPPSEANGGAPKLERAPKLDNSAVLELVQAGFSEGTILRKIEGSQVDFDTSPKALTELRRNRVSERIIKAMTEAMGVEGK